LRFKSKYTIRQIIIPSADVALSTTAKIGMIGALRITSGLHELSRDFNPSFEKKVGADGTLRVPSTIRPDKYYSSFLKAGNNSTSRMECLFVNNIVRRSTPMPKPPQGGIP